MLFFSAHLYLAFRTIPAIAVQVVDVLELPDTKLGDPVYPTSESLGFSVMAVPPNHSFY